MITNMLYTRNDQAKHGHNLTDHCAHIVWRY